jgi:release factor glutamine methyltransferase
MMTCRDALRTASGMLAKAGVPDPAVDAAFLLSHVTGVPHLMLRADGGRELTQGQTDAYRALIDRRCSREPLQYILGTAQFMGITLRAEEGALIPRNDTETLCEQAFARMKGNERVLDLCTGTGALAIAAALRFPRAQVTACDISPDALAVARKNIAETGAAVRLLEGDLFAPVAGERFDMILSNPPYVTAQEMASLQPEVQREPALALYGGEDGLSFYRRIVREAPGHLQPGGWLLLEIGTHQAEAVTALMQGDFEAPAVYPDMQGLPRAVVGRLIDRERL